MLDKINLNIKWSPHTRAIIRCLLGVTTALLIATINNIISPQIAAIFALMLLDKGKNALGIKKSVAAIFVLYLLGLFGLVLGGFVQEYALVTLLILGLVIFWTFRLIKIPEPVRLVFLMLTLLLPFLSLTAEPLGDLILLDMIINLAIALVVTELAFLFIPENSTIEKISPEKAEEETHYNLDKIALNGLLVLLPAVLYFYYFRPNSLALTFVFILILSIDPKIYKSKKGLILILANLFGGACGVVVYNLLTITPTFFFYIFLMLVVGLFFTYHIFSGKKTVPIYTIAYRTFFLVMGIISNSSESVGDSIVERLFGIGMAVVYVVLAYKVLTYLNDPRIYENEMV
jgi:MFS family permease